MNSKLQQMITQQSFSQEQAEDKLYKFLQTCSPKQEATITSEQWTWMFREFGGMYTSKLEEFLELPIVKRHIDEKDSSGATLMQKHLLRIGLSGRSERVVQALYIAGAKVPANAVDWAIKFAEEDLLLWLHNHEVDITEGGREVNLILYKEYAYGRGKEPNMEVVKIMESKILKRNLEKVGKGEEPAPAPKKRFI